MSRVRVRGVMAIACAFQALSAQATNAQECNFGPNGQFGVPTTITTSGPFFSGSGEAGLSLAIDLDHDGWPDLILASTFRSNLSISYNNGSGGFLPPIAYETVSPSDITAGDVDSDGALDLVISNAGSFSSEWGVFILQSIPGGGLNPVSQVYDSPVDRVWLADLDNDGRLDLLTRHGQLLRTHLNSGSGAFAPPTSIDAVTALNELASGDFDLDGYIDVLVSSSLGVSLLRGLGDGQFAAPVSVGSFLTASSAVAGDVNGDGVLDAVVGGVRAGVSGSHIWLLAGDGIGGFSEPQVLADFSGRQRATLADLNADGVLDLINGISNPEVTVLLSTAGGDYEMPFTPYLGDFGDIGASRAVADLDGDGALDLAYPVKWFVMPGVNQESMEGLTVVHGLSEVVAEDSFAPNQSCLSSVALTPTGYTDLVAFKFTGGDFFELTVPAESSLGVDVQFSHESGDIDCYLYDAVTVGSTCGNKTDYLVRGFSATDNESVSWTNTTGVTQTYYLQVALWNNANNADCNTYDLVVSISTPSFGSSMCAGDGSVIDCPCGNEAVAADEGCQNSKSAGAKISATGSSVVSNDDAVFLLSQGISGDPALLLEGRSAIATPFRDGIFCMGGFTTRLQAVMMDGDGNAATSGSIAGSTNLVPGQTRYYQWWYRDPGGVSPCGSGSNFSGGLQIQWE